jgi:hypothetical protein
MFELSAGFIISQIAMFIAMVFDFLSLQFKKREYTFFMPYCFRRSDKYSLFFIG